MSTQVDTRISVASETEADKTPAIKTNLCPKCGEHVPLTTWSYLTREGSYHQWCKPLSLRGLRPIT